MRPPSFPSVALCLGLGGAQVLAFFGEVPSHALKDPINVPPIRTEELYPHLRKRDEDWSRFNLQDEVKLLWAHNNQDGKVVFDMDIQKPDQKHRLLALEELDTFTESIVCKEPTITLKFRSEAAIGRAEKEWGWINGADTDYFYLIANHDGCGPDAMRHPYKVVQVDNDAKNLTTTFTTQNVDWEEVTPNHKMSIGTSPHIRRTSASDTSAPARIMRREEGYCFYLWRMLGVFCGGVQKPGPGFFERLGSSLRAAKDNTLDSFEKFPSDLVKGAKGVERIPGALFDAGVTFTNGMKQIPAELAVAEDTFIDGVTKIPGEVGQAFAHNFQLASGVIVGVAEDIMKDISDAANGAKAVVTIVEKVVNFQEAIILLLMGEPMTFDFATTEEDAKKTLYPPITTGPVEFSSECNGCQTKGRLVIRAEWFMNGGSLLNPIFWVETKGVTGSLPIKHKVAVDLEATEEDDMVALFPVPGITPFTIGAVSVGPVVMVGGGLEGKLKVAGAFTTGLNYTIPDGTMELRPTTPSESRLTGFEGGASFKPSFDLDELNMQAEASVFGMARLGAGLAWGKGSTLGAWADFKGGFKGTLKIGSLDNSECPAKFGLSATGLIGDRIDKTEKPEGKTAGVKAAIGTFYEVSVAAGLSVSEAKVSFKMVDGGTEIAGFCIAAPILDLANEQRMATLQPTKAPAKDIKKQVGPNFVKQTPTGQIESGMILIKGMALEMFAFDGSEATI
ncbi:hypothetical protein TWF788_004031 [Orbilia oligospora]|uniref:DUF7029 domain-containing protein n=1 Tax=Orbilia oligospora TaxID=2813651 RepID=A0A7C8JYR5_ORBOL|nr:hypothetical protein TWF788_004031 [Orbilia oligospora]